MLKIYTVKKVSLFPAPVSGMSITKLSLDRDIGKLFPARESLVSDTPAGDGKNDNLFAVYFLLLDFLRSPLSI
jgi:hypothetical protein